MKIDQSKCKHRWVVISVTGESSKTLRCPKCQLRREVPLTKSESSKMKKQHEAMKKESEKLHALGWAYQEAFYQTKRRKFTAAERKNMRKMMENINVRRGVPKKRISIPKYSVSRDGFKYEGFQMMTRMRIFAKKHPDIVLCGCDDSGHCGSLIAFIPHRTEREFWGTTVVTIPQFGRVEELFFYPGHAIAVEKALAVFNKEWRAKNKAQKAKKDAFWPKP